ncbi:hypothetical protein K6119_11165 [Paracrocinitomix mangrovi]|uniref:hypothetical protein n=1 Tax=Paracrocinitomix mangrovi TaxID=2862509 RepID=UPI001C8D79F9|nr:hypothetical protein [Paracrocinitomix mangrovi]UKN00294.1 hypothetical protein K6119_11165 [Paracrocinitomix mangrovi]
MSEDFQLILGSYLFQWVVLALVLIVTKKKKKPVLWINLGIQIAYSVFFIVSFFNAGPGGVVLSVLVFWMFTIWLHWFLTLVHLTIILISRSTSNSFVQKVYDTVFFIFVLASALLLFGTWTGVISYGLDDGTKYMQIGILGGLILATLFKIFLYKLTSKPKKIIGIFLSLIMLFLCFYYLTEDHFRIH